MSNPELIIVAGPNGAGKTTSIAQILKTHEIAYINADEIYKGLAIGKSKPSHLHITAGKTAIKLANDYINRKQSFIIETTLSGLFHVKLIEQAKQNGFRIKLLYLYLNSPDIAVERVEQRHKLGGHNIPKDDIIRRYHKSLHNLYHVYRTMVDELTVLNNTGSEKLHIYGKIGTIENITDKQVWQSIKESKQ